MIDTQSVSFAASVWLLKELKCLALPYSHQKVTGSNPVLGAMDNEPKIMETEKFDRIGWFDIESLPEPLFEAVRLYIISYKTGKVYNSVDEHG